VHRIRVLGVGVDCVDMAEALNIVAAWVLAGGPCRQVATVNPEFVMRARRDADFAAALERAESSGASPHDRVRLFWALARAANTDGRHLEALTRHPAGDRAARSD